MLPNEFVYNGPFTPPGCLSFPGSDRREIECVADFFELIQPYLGPAAQWWFRGESAVYSAPSLPSFARDYVQLDDGSSPSKNINELELVVPLTEAGNGQPVLLSCLTKQELEIIKNFQTNAPNDQYYENLVGDDPNHPGWLSYAQHYGGKTRLVDVTSDPLVGLYFASDPSLEGDGRVWMYPNTVDLHGNHPPETLENAFEPAISDSQGLEFARTNRLHDYQPNVLRPLLIDSVFLFDFDAPNKRISAQRGKFLWSGSPLKPLYAGCIGINIPEANKEHIRNTLSALSIHNGSLFPC